MWNWIRVKHKHIFQNLNYKRKKSNDKYPNAIRFYVDLLKREKKEWLTKWIAKTMIKAQAKLKKYWITDQMVKNYIQAKWLKDLLS